MKQQSKKYLLLILLIAVLIAPSFALASWWNPFSWGIWNRIFHWQNPSTQQNQNTNQNNSKIPITEGTLRKATLTYPNPYDKTKNDVIVLANGRAFLSDAGNIKPRAYDVAKTAVGDLNGDGVADGAIGVYQGYGANIITPVVFALSDKNEKLTQLDATALPGQLFNAEIKSLSINNGVLSVDILAVSEYDMKNLAHVEWKPTQAKTFQYKLINGKLVEQPSDQPAGWKTYTSDQLMAMADADWKNKAMYFKGLEGNFLIIDQGTAPDPRGLIIYDLSAKKEVLSDRYSKPLDITSASVDYWNPTNEKITAQNCPDSAKWASQGLGAGMESRVSFSLTSLTKKELGADRCMPRQ